MAKMRRKMSNILLLCFGMTYLRPAVTGRCTESRIDLLNVNESSSYYHSNVLMEIIHILRWSHVIIIFESSSENYVNTDFLFRHLHDKGTQTVWIDYVDDGMVTSLKPLISDANARHYFLIIGDDAFVARVMEEMPNKFFLGPSATRLNTSTHNSSNLWRLSPMTTEWLILTDPNDLDTLSQNETLADWEHVVVVTTSRPSSVWTLQRSGNAVQLINVTSLGPPDRAVIRRDLLPNLSQGLGGRTLRVLVREFYYLASKTIINGSEVFTGVHIDIIDELSRRLNFSYTLQDSPDGSFGRKLDSGHWDGLVGMLARQEADLGVAFFRPILDRVGVVDPTDVFVYEGAYLIVKAPAPPEDYPYFFLAPFQTEVYAFMAGSFLLTLAIMILARFCRWRTQTQRRDGSRPDVTQWIREDIQMVVAGVLARAHQTSQPAPPAGHLALTMFYACSVALTAMYSSQLTSELTVRDVTLPFSNMAELVQQREYKWGVSNGTAHFSIIKDSKNKVLRAFYEGVIGFLPEDPDVVSMSFDVQREKVLQGKYVYFFDSPVIASQWQTLSCDIVTLPVHELMKPSVLFLQKFSPFTDMFSKTVSRMSETGLVTAMLQKWTPDEKRCAASDDRAISLQQAKTSLYVLAGGAALSALLLVVELYCPTCNTHNHTR